MSEVTIESLQKLVDKKDEELKELRKKLDEFDKKVTDLDSLRGKHGTELGELRKKVDEYEGRITALTEDRDAVKQELEALKKPKSDGQVPPANEKPLREQADELEATLSEDEKKEVEEAVKEAGSSDDPLLREAAEAFKKSAEEPDNEEANRARIAFLSKVKPKGEAHPSLWRVNRPPAKDKDIERVVEKLLNKRKGIATDERAQRTSGVRREDPSKMRRLF